MCYAGSFDSASSLLVGSTLVHAWIEELYHICKFGNAREKIQHIIFVLEYYFFRKFAFSMVTIYFVGCAEQGQLGRVAECFSVRGGRKGLGMHVSNSVCHY